MKRKNMIYSFALPAVVLSMLITMSAQTISTGDTEGSDTEAATELTPVDKETAGVMEVFNGLYAQVGNPEYSVMQGGCTDGTYAYFVMENQAVTNSMDEIVKMRMSDWSIVKVSTDIDINHGNDLTYNSKTNKIIAVHNKPNYNTLSVINPETLKVESKVTLSSKVYSVAYNESKDEYVVGISGSEQFQILNSSFKIVKMCTGVKTEYTHQGMDCDDKYIYFIQSGIQTGYNDNIILVYDWDGNHIKNILVDVPLEGESLFHVGSTFYANFHSSSYRGTVYQLALPLD